MKTITKIFYLLCGVGLVCLPYIVNNSKLEREVPNYDVITNNCRVVNLGTAEEIRVSSNEVNLEREVVVWTEPCKACQYMAKHPELR
jgi:hypothetical protein